MKLIKELKIEIQSLKDRIKVIRTSLSMTYIGRIFSEILAKYLCLSYKKFLFICDSELVA